MCTRADASRHCRFACQAFWLLVVLGIGCENIVQVDIPQHTPVLVANGLFGPDSDWEVRLYRSKPILEDGPIQAIVDGTVHVFDDVTVVATLAHVGDGLYRQQGGTRPRAGRRYTLRASAPGLEQIAAVDSVPTPVPILASEIDRTSDPWRITINFTDPPQIKNYYQLLVLAQIEEDVFPAWFESDDLLLGGLGELDGDDAYFDDSLIAGQNYSLRIRLYGYEPIRQVFVQLLSVSEAYHRYVTSTKDLGENPFVEPAIVFSNVDHGLGIFAGYSVASVSLL